MIIGRRGRGRRTLVALTSGLVAVTAAVPAASASAGDQAGHDLGQGRYPYAGSIDVELPTNPESCDPLGGVRCLLPFPNDYFTARDRSTETGRRIDLGPGATPANAAGVHIDPTELNRNDGFSPGSAVVALLPGVDLAASGAAPITDMGSSLDRDAPIVVIDARTPTRRHPYWAELDSRAPDDAHRLLFVRPAENFREGHRYIVAIRDVVDAAGQPIEASDVFRAYRDRLDTGIDAIESRRAHMDDLFRRLRRAGVDR
ncbi:MAG: hypothetical protein ACRDZS_09345, partial [Acidimicrobiales bacterium]